MGFIKKDALSQHSFTACISNDIHINRLYTANETYIIAWNGRLGFCSDTYFNMGNMHGDQLTPSCVMSVTIGVPNN